jgi:hypothetical protein
MTSDAQPGILARRRGSLAAGLAVVGTVGVAVGIVFFYFVYPIFRAGPAQPIPFSHRIHVGIKEIDCRFCHSTVERSPNAGLPPAEKCLFCHQFIITQHPVIQELHRYRDQNMDIPWRKVTYLPQFTHFTHEQHIRAGISCEECHGRVQEMDRVFEQNRLLMGFCLNCHRGNVVQDRNAPVDCYTCHQ